VTLDRGRKPVGAGKPEMSRWTASWSQTATGNVPSGGPTKPSDDIINHIQSERKNGRQVSAGDGGSPGLALSTSTLVESSRPDGGELSRETKYYTTSRDREYGRRRDCALSERVDKGTKLRRKSSRRKIRRKRGGPDPERSPSRGNRWRRTKALGRDLTRAGPVQTGVRRVLTDELGGGHGGGMGTKAELGGYGASKAEARIEFARENEWREKQLCEDGGGGTFFGSTHGDIRPRNTDRTSIYGTLKDR